MKIHFDAHQSLGFLLSRYEFPQYAEEAISHFKHALDINSDNFSM